VRLDDFQPVPAEVYNRDYFLHHMEGADDFEQTRGGVLSPRLAYALELAHVQPGQCVLDLGCGRGEVAWRCAQLQAEAHGLDYSRAALEISAELRAQAQRAGMVMHLEQAVAYQLPFAAQSFDSVLMLDIVEHLYSPELLSTFVEVHRILKPGGKLIIHTMPNADYYRWGYPLYRFTLGWLGRNLPRDPRQRWYRGETHVNVQSPVSLRQALRTAGFVSPRVWLQPLNNSPRMRWLIGLYPLRWILCNDILAVVAKG